MKVIGIDPGFSGALAYLDSDGSFGMFPMPLAIDQFGKTIVDAYKIARFIKTINPDYVCIEKLGTFGENSGKKSISISGMNWGRIVGLVEAMGIKIFVAETKKWQREMGVLPGDEASKIRIHRRALEIFPHADFSKPKGFYSKFDFHDGKTDALMLAKHGMKNLQRIMQLTKNP